MQRPIVHSNYIARIALEIHFWENGIKLPYEADAKKQAVQKDFSYRGKVITLRLFSLRNSTAWFLLLGEEVDANWLVNEYLAETYTAGLDLPDGGLVYIDENNNELVQTNLDIGETEEWVDVLDNLSSLVQ